MEKNKNKNLNDIFEIFNEFSKVSNKKYTSQELLSSADNLIKIAKGKISKKKIFNQAYKPSMHSSDTYLKMTEDPWSSYHDFRRNVLPYDDNDFAHTSSFPSFREINEGWV